MKTKSRISIATTLTALIATLAAYGSFQPARAADNGKPHEKACTVANVAGAYGVYGSGTILPGNQVGAPPGPFATIGRAELDGNGVFLVTSQTASFNGVIIRNITGQGTYTVNADCTGQIGIGTDTADVVFVDSGNEFYATDTTSGLITTFVFKRTTARE
jgi:hypothetical protein